MHTSLRSALKVTADLVAGVKMPLIFPLNRDISFCAFCVEVEYADLVALSSTEMQC